MSFLWPPTKLSQQETEDSFIACLQELTMPTHMLQSVYCLFPAYISSLANAQIYDRLGLACGMTYYRALCSLHGDREGWPSIDLIAIDKRLHTFIKDHCLHYDELDASYLLSAEQKEATKNMTIIDYTYC